MNEFRRRLLNIAAAAPFWPALSVAAIPKPKAPRALGYVPWWMAEAWRDMPLAQIDRLVLFELIAHGDGRVKDNDWATRARDIAAYARERHVPVDVALTVQGERLFNEIFGD